MADYLLKIEPPFLDALLDGTKTFEVRRNDRGYQKGDVLVFDMAWPEHPSETSLRCVRFTVSYVLSGWGIKPGFVVLGLAPRGETQDQPVFNPMSILPRGDGPAFA